LQTATGDAVKLHCVIIVIQTTKQQHSQNTQFILHMIITPQHSILADNVAPPHDPVRRPC